MKKSLNLLFMILLCTPIVSQTSVASDSPDSKNAIPIQLNSGHISTIIEGKLSPQQRGRWYKFKAKQGQYVVVNISSLQGVDEIANVGGLTAPSGAQDGSKGGIVYQGCLSETGTYKLRIARNLMATNGGEAGYHVEVVILPKYASDELCG